MTLTSWLKKKYPESSKNSAEIYAIIRKAKDNKKLSTFAALICVYLVTFYSAKIISLQFGEELAKGTVGTAIYIAGFIFGSLIFLLIRNFLVKKEIEKLLKA